MEWCMLVRELELVIQKEHKMVKPPEVETIARMMLEHQSITRVEHDRVQNPVLA
jgi:hypothetical protein